MGGLGNECFFDRSKAQWWLCGVSGKYWMCCLSSNNALILFSSSAIPGEELDCIDSLTIGGEVVEFENGRYSDEAEASFIYFTLTVFFQPTITSWDFHTLQDKI